MKKFRDFLLEVNVDRNTNFKSVLLKPLTDIFDKMRDVDDKEWDKLNKKAKAEFKKARISGMDYHGFMDFYYSLRESNMNESMNLKSLEKDVIKLLQSLKQAPVGKEWPNDSRGWKVTQDKWNGKPSVRVQWVHDKQSHELRMARDNQKKFLGAAESKWKDEIAFHSSAHQTDIYLVPK